MAKGINLPELAKAELTPAVVKLLELVQELAMVTSSHVCTNIDLFQATTDISFFVRKDLDFLTTVGQEPELLATDSRGLNTDCRR